MDGQRFDRLVRAWGAPTRRGAVGLALGAVTLLLPGGEAAAARCKNLGAACSRQRGDRCCGDGTCRDGRCACPGGAEEIRGECFFRGGCAPNASVCDGKCGKTAGGGRRPDCFCGTTVDGQSRCFRNASLCTVLCATNADCPAGQACFAVDCDVAAGTCLKPCRRQDLN